MASEKFSHKLKNTFWVTAEAIVEYGCAAKPAVIKEHLHGTTRFGFILSYEDKLNGIAVHRAKMFPCEQSDCGRAVKYELELKYYISCEIGIGINIGKFGTGTFGFPTRLFEETANFTTECVCCDDEIDLHRQQQWILRTPADSGERSVTALLLSLAAIGIGTVGAIAQASEPGSAAEIFLGVITSAVVTSGIIVWRRYAALMREAKKKNEEYLR